MDFPTVVLVLTAGFGGGVIAGLVGGGSLITFPVMLYIGLPPIVATASNIVALTLSNIAAVFADYKRVPAWNKRFAIVVACSIFGSIVGAVLLLLSGEEKFTTAIPLLMGFGTALFAFSENIKRWANSHAAGARRTDAYGTTQLVLVTITAAYGGYFGASFTIMLLAVLSLGSNDFRSVNVTKNVLAGLIGIVAVILFVVQSVIVEKGVVAWWPTTILTLGALVGGYVGGFLGKIIPVKWVRYIVIGIGMYLTMHYARKYWLL